MSVASQRLLNGTSKPAGAPALLVLEDGTVYEGTSCAAEGEVFGEICFNTSLGGYLEMVTDPAYAGRIITMTYPQVGNYGVNLDDCQSAHPACAGLVVRDMCATPSNWRSQMSFSDYLKDNGVVAIENVDTRALVRHIRAHGSMRAVISTEGASAAELLEKVRACASCDGVNLVEKVSCADRRFVDSVPSCYDFALHAPAAATRRVVVYDCGVTESALHGLVRLGCAVTVVAWNTPAAEVLALEPAGVFVSNGPGDPAALGVLVDQISQLIGKVPVFGAGIGHSLVAMAAGARTFRMHVGHFGGNEPVENLLTGRVEITAQNHAYAVDFASSGELVPELSAGRTAHESDLRAWARLGVAPVVSNERFGRIQLTHVNLNDGTVEGLTFLDAPVLTAQHHPDAAGPADSHYLLTAFCRLMDGREDYLDIDNTLDRLEGWRFASDEAALADSEVSNA